MSHPTKGKSKYDFLLAMAPGETYQFQNLPTAGEGRRKVAPTARKAYFRINGAISHLQRNHPGLTMSISVATSPGSRINGDMVVVTMLAIDGSVARGDDLEARERRRQQSLEAWRKRKQAEDAPKLNGQLEEESAADLARRVAGAVKRQIAPAEPPKYDPVKLAGLVAFHTRGGMVQLLTENGWRDDPVPTWREPTCKYRQKPVRRDFYIIIGRTGEITTVADDPGKLPHHDPDCRIHVREVLPEEEEEL